MECALYEASDCFIVTNPEGKYGVWNIINGTEVISCEYDEYRILDYLECGSTEDHRYLAIGVCQDGLWGFVRSDGRICCPPQFDDIMITWNIIILSELKSMENGDSIMFTEQKRFLVNMMEYGLSRATNARSVKKQAVPCYGIILTLMAII